MTCSLNSFSHLLKWIEQVLDKQVFTEGSWGSVIMSLSWSHMADDCQSQVFLVFCWWALQPMLLLALLSLFHGGGMGCSLDTLRRAGKAWNSSLDLVSDYDSPSSDHKCSWRLLVLLSYSSLRPQLKCPLCLELVSLSHY